MINNVSAKFAPSFGKVIPIKKIVFDDNSAVTYQQTAMDEFLGEDTTQIDSSCAQETAQKTIQALVRVLTKNDKAEQNTYQNALNNMIRRAFAYVDRDYKIPATPIQPTQNHMVKPCYGDALNYVLTGKEAEEYAVAGKNIGGSKALVRDFNAPGYVADRAQAEFGLRKNYILANNQSRLRTNIGTNLGLVIYADKIDVNQKGSKGIKTEIKIKGIDFEPV